MEIASWHLIAIVLLLLVLLAVFFGIIKPIWNNIAITKNQTEKIDACRAWSKLNCTEITLSRFKHMLGCSDYEDCKKICRYIGFCW